MQNDNELNRQSPDRNLFFESISLVRAEIQRPALITPNSPSQPISYMQSIPSPVAETVMPIHGMQSLITLIIKNILNRNCFNFYRVPKDHD